MESIALFIYFAASIPLYCVMGWGIYKALNRQGSTLWISSLIGFIYAFVLLVLFDLWLKDTMPTQSDDMARVILMIIFFTFSMVMQWVSVAGSYYYIKRKRYIAVLIFHLFISVVMVVVYILRLIGISN